MEDNKNNALVVVILGGHKVLNDLLGKIVRDLTPRECRVVELKSFERSFFECYVGGETDKLITFLDSTLMNSLRETTREFQKLEVDHPLKMNNNSIILFGDCPPIGEKDSTDFRLLTHAAKEIGAKGFIPLPIRAYKCRKRIRECIKTA